MKLVTYLHNGKEAVGVLSEDGTAVHPLPFPDMNALIEAPREQLLAAAEAAKGALPLAAVTLLAPIPRPRQDIICLGMNYRDHLTTLMVTHTMKDAIAHGNRPIMMYDGRIAIDVSGEEKKKLTVPDLLALFSKVSGSDEADDKLLLS